MRGSAAAGSAAVGMAAGGAGGDLEGSLPFSCRRGRRASRRNGMPAVSVLFVRSGEGGGGRDEKCEPKWKRQNLQPRYRDITILVFFLRICSTSFGPRF